MQPSQPEEAPPSLQRREKALLTTRLRSETLLTVDGYSVATHPSLKPGLYVVTRPEATLDKATGELIEGYTVDLTAPSCTCKMFEFSRDKEECKHLRAVLRHIGQCYNLLAPMLMESGLMLAQAGLAIPSLAAPTTPALRACPHCKHPDTIALPDYPGQWVCPECLRISDELLDEGFGARMPTAETRVKIDRPAPIKFATAPNPTPSTPKLRPGRGIPSARSARS